MSSKKGLGRLYDRLTLEERFRLDVLVLARGDQEESESLTAICSRRDHACNKNGKTGEPPGWEADEEEAERNADPTIDENLQKWSGEGRYDHLERELEEMERELVREALTAWLGFALM